MSDFRILSSWSTERKTEEVLECWEYRTGLTTWLQRGSNQRHDLFGFIDLVGVSCQHVGFLCVQATDSNNFSARIKKITKDCYWQVLDVLSAGNRIEVWGWKFYKKLNHWDARRVEIYDIPARASCKRPGLVSRILPTAREEHKFRQQFNVRSIASLT